MVVSRKDLAVLSVELLSIVLTIVLGYVAVSEGVITQFTGLLIFAVVLLSCEVVEGVFVDWS